MVNIVKSALSLFGISKDEDVASYQGGVVNLDDFLKGLPQALGFDVEFVRTQNEDGSHQIEIKGEERLSFLGENTQLLDSLAHISMRVLRKQEGLANKAVEEGTDLSKYRVTVDAEGFREKHHESLRLMAEKAKEKVLANNGRPAYIPALSPSERRIIHTHLVTLGEVTSESIGNGTFKRIRIKLINEAPRAPREAGAQGNRQQGGGGRGGYGRRDNNRGPRQDRPQGGGGYGGYRPGAAPKNMNGGNEVRKARFDDYQQSGSDEVNGNVEVKISTQDEDIDDNIGNR